MFDLLKARIRHGYQAIPDIRKPVLASLFRGFPLLEKNLLTKEEGLQCESECPNAAFVSRPLSIDIGKCVFCGECASIAKSGAVKFSNFHKTSTTDRNKLIIDPEISIKDYFSKAIEARKEIKSIFGRSLKLRSVSAGGCSACELELNACSNVNFDMGRFGIDMVASPRHADGIVITGPITKNMAYALNDTWNAISDPKILVAYGTCAISGGLFAGSEEIDRTFLETNKPDLFVPGCPPHPLTFVNGLIAFLGLKK